MTATTSAPRVAQQDDKPPSRAPALAGAPPRRPAPDNRLVAQLLVATDATDDEFLGTLYRQLVGTVLDGGEINKNDLAFMHSAVTGIKPRDRLEYMLVAQMAAVHLATMTSARRLRRADDIPKQDSAERAFNKLARTFATQMEAFTRYRTGGEQKVVQHVSVSDGGRAIVGNVTQPPRT